jgi:hypothetical protein
VLCCGPEQELVPIAKIMGRGLRVLGTDLAPGMVELSRRRIGMEWKNAEEDEGGGGEDTTS